MYNKTHSALMTPCFATDFWGLLLLLLFFGWGVFFTAFKAKAERGKVTKRAVFRPVLDARQPVTGQCQRHLVNVCCGVILQQLFRKNTASKSMALDLLEEAVRQAEVTGNTP